MFNSDRGHSVRNTIEKIDVLIWLAKYLVNKVKKKVRIHKELNFIKSTIFCQV